MEWRRASAFLARVTARSSVDRVPLYRRHLPDPAEDYTLAVAIKSAPPSDCNDDKECGAIEGERILLVLPCKTGTGSSSVQLLCLRCGWHSGLSFLRFPVKETDTESRT